MNSFRVIRITQALTEGLGKGAAQVKGLLVAVLLLSLMGCASGVAVVETWDGNPTAAADAAVLKAPGAIQVSQVNGREMTNFLMDDLALDYALLPGTNEVVFIYKTIWAKSGVVRNGESKVQVINSKPQVVRFDAKAGETYRFEFDQPESRQQAEQEMPAFSAAVVSASGSEVADSIVWDGKQRIIADRTPLPESAAASPALTNANALSRLKAIWETASDDEKKAFLRWAFE